MKTVYCTSITFLMLLFAGQTFAQQSCVTSQCHTAFAEENSFHPAEWQCTSCHLDTQEKHSEGGAPPALKEKMCMPCHNDVLDYQVSHAPVTQSTCQLCHDPHGELKSLLLDDCNFSRLFVDYNENSYKLCFSCHKRDLLMFPDTIYSTEFRDGKQNLHYLHVNKSNRGRSCKLCHGVHGADQPKLMADTVFFGDWRMPVNFKKNETGGSCTPGCHAPRSYDRKVGRKQLPAQEKNE